MRDPSADMLKGLHLTSCPCCHGSFRYIGISGDTAWVFQCPLGRYMLMPSETASRLVTINSARVTFNESPGGKGE